MSIELPEEMENSEFALTEEEKAEYEALQKAENSGDDDDQGDGNGQEDEVDNEFLENLINPKQDDADPGTDTPPNDDKPNDGESNPGNQPPADDNQEDLSIQQHQENQAQLEQWEAKLTEATEAKEIVLSELEDLGKKLDDGEIGEGEYQSKRERLKDSLRDHNKNIQIAEQGLEKAEQQYQSFAAEQQKKAVETWHSELQRFATENPAYNPTGQDTRYAVRFDEVLADLNQKKAFDGLSFTQIIDMVKYRVEMELGAPKQTPPPKQEKQQKPPKREGVNIPPSVSQMSIAEPNDPGDEFAAIDNLQGLAFESALEKLEKNNPEAYKRYINR